MTKKTVTSIKSRRGDKPKLRTVSHINPLGGDRSPIQRFCGPGAISAVTGQAAEVAAAWINHYNGKPFSHLVRGAGESALCHAAHHLGWDLLRISTQTLTNVSYTKTPRLFEVLRDRHPDLTAEVLVIAAGDHWVAVQGDRISDNQQGLVRLGKSWHRSKRIQWIYRVRPGYGKPNRTRRLKRKPLWPKGARIW